MAMWIMRGNSHHSRSDNRMLRRILFLFVFPSAVAPFGVSTLKQRPFIRGAPPLRQSQHQQNHENDEEEESSGLLGLYVHIPYCRRRCNYCDFAIVPIGSREDKDAIRNSGFENMDANYKSALLNEIDAIGKSSVETIRLQSIYFGGGTPSLAPLSTLQDVMNALLTSENAPFCLDENAEVTIEMDPGTFDSTYLEAVKEMGFDRISLGVQSFNDDVLAAMGRVHRVADVRRSVEMIGNVFGERDANYSIDLISGAPGLTLAGWAETLREATRLRPRPRHASLYDLQVEEGTVFGRWYGVDGGEDDVVARDEPVFDRAPRDGRPVLPSAEDCAFMYGYASGYLRSMDYEHYEISSYALGGSGDVDRGSSYRRSVHNQIYWRYNGQWHAIGLGATSRVGGVRFARPRALSDYVSWTEGLARDSADSSPGRGFGGDGKDPPWLSKEPNARGDPSDDNDKLLDVVMTRLRTSDGLDLDWVAGHDKYGEPHVRAILRGFDLALDLDLGVRDVSPDGNHGCIRLNDPKGFLFSNNIISNVFLELSEMDS